MKVLSETISLLDPILYSGTVLVSVCLFVYVCPIIEQLLPLDNKIEHKLLPSEFYLHPAISLLFLDLVQSCP